jgi:hypothetical protein
MFSIPDVKAGDRRIFAGIYHAYKERHGQACVIIRVFDKPDTDHDEESLPMYEVRFESDGMIIDAWPEEIQIAAGMTSNPAMEYMMKERADELIKALSPHSLWAVSITGGVFNHCDFSIDIEGVTIYTNEDILGQYQVAKCVRIPGRMYYRDGSGDPDSDELVDVGEPHKSLDNAIIEACKLLVEARLHDFLEAEAEVKAEEEWKDLMSRERI